MGELTGRKFQRVILFACLIVSMAVAVYLTLVIVRYPFVGADVVVNDGEVTIRGLSGYGQADAVLREGDIVRSIDGQPATGNPSVRQHHAIDHAESLELIRNGNVHQYETRGYSSVAGVVFYFIVPVTFSLICLVLGWFLCLGKWRALGEPELVLFMAAINPVFLAISAHFRNMEGPDYGRVTTFSMLFGLVLMVHFLRVYFSYWNMPFISKRFLGALYLCAVLVFLSVSLFPVRVLNGRLPLELIFTSAVFLIVVSLGIRLFFQTRKVEKRNLLHVLIAGITLSLFPFVALYALPAMIAGTEILEWPWTSLFLVLMPLVLFYLCRADNFIDVPFLARRLVYYGIAGMVSVVAVMPAFLALTWGRVTYARMDMLRLGLVLFLVTVSVLFVKEYLDFSLRKRLYPRRKDFQASLSRFLQWMDGSHDLEDLAWVLKREIEAGLPVSMAALLRAGQHLRPVDSEEKLPDDRLEKIIAMADQAGAFRETSDGFSAVLSEQGAEKIVMIGLWKKRRHRIGPDERIWLTTLLNDAQIMIENLYRTEDFMRVLEKPGESRVVIPVTIRKMMLRISEQERLKLARQLHDQNMQDQLAIARVIDAWDEKWKDPAVRRQFRRIREQILDSVYVLRQVIYELYPELIHRAGLPGSLHDLFEKVNLRADFMLDVSVDQQLMVQDREMEITIYRVIQELLNNAMKHSRAKKVVLRLARRDQEYWLTYDDNGVGTKVPRYGDVIGTMGLPGMISRVEGHDGQWQMRSEPGKGFHVVITIPASA